MGLFDLFARRPALSEGLEQYRNTPGAILLDVRTLLPGDEAEIAAARSEKPAPGPAGYHRRACREPAVHLLPQRGAERPGQSPAGAGGVFRHRSGGPAGLPRAAGSIGREAA